MSSLPIDPLQPSQWYLFGGNGANITPVWAEYSGAGVTVGIFDQGIDHLHPDLDANVLATAGRRASNLSFGGAPVLAGDNHGTMVAGVIAAERNGVGIVGAAYEARLVSIYSPLSGSLSTDIPNAYSYARGTVDILNDSWGFGNAFQRGTDYAFVDNFRRAPYNAAGAALAELAAQGRGGLGTVVVQSAGNSQSFGDDTNLHNFQNSQYIITVAATDTKGEVTSYSSPGASILVAAPGGGGNNADSAILTTDRVGVAGQSASDYTTATGTSFSSPIVSGIVALMLQANPQLGYRDVQEILAYSARKTGSAQADWDYNGAANWNGGGLHYDINDFFGFGLVDARAAVRLAETWLASSGSAAQTQAHTAANRQQISASLAPALPIPDNNISGASSTIEVAQDMRVERVEVVLQVTHSFIGDLSVLLTSPSGTQSFLLYQPGSGALSAIGSSQDNIDFSFTTTLSWGEASRGTWTLRIVDDVQDDAGRLDAWTLNLIGKPAGSDDAYVYTDEFAQAALDEPARGQLADAGGNDTLNAAAVTSDQVLDLRMGATSTVAGRSLVLAAGTQIENAIGGDGNDVLTGNDADNTLWGMRGNDRLDGGAGTDTAQFVGEAARYTVGKTAAGFTVIDKRGFMGEDHLSAIERLQFADRGFALAGPAPTNPGAGQSDRFLFDAVYYLLDHPELVPSQNLVSAAQQYFDAGAAQGFSPNAWFDAAYYRGRWGDLAASGLDDASLFKHYNLHGVWEGRSAGPAFDRFDGGRYLAENPDVAAYVDAHLPDFLGSRSNGAIAHYVIFGGGEGRAAADLLGQPIRLDYTLDLGA